MTAQNMIITTYEVKVRFLREFEENLGPARWAAMRGEQREVVEAAAEVGAEVVLLGITGSPLVIKKRQALAAIIANATYTLPEGPSGPTFGEVFWPIAAKIGGGALKALEGVASVAVAAAAQGLVDGAARSMRG